VKLKQKKHLQFIFLCVFCGEDGDIQLTVMSAIDLPIAIIPKTGPQ
jgi:hypothetical protein